MQMDSNRKLEQFIDKEFEKIRKKKKNINATSKYFQEIGSTTCEDIPYDLQLDIKKSALINIFQNLATEEVLNKIQLTASPKTLEYRLKMDFVCSYDPTHEPKSRFGQRKKGKFNWIVDMNECNLIDSKWFKKIRQLYDLTQELGIRNYDLKKFDGELRYIVTKIYKDAAMINFVTRSDTNKDEIEQVAQKSLELGFESVYWQVQNKVSDISEGETKKFWGSDYINVPLIINDNKKVFKVYPNTFFQNNIYCFEKLLEYIYDTIPNEKLTLYDLYCGVGTIGLSLAHEFKKVVGIEINVESIKLAKENAVLNNVRNVEFISGDLSKYQAISVEENIVIVDPPRNGLGKESVNNLLKLNPKCIVYISCNPITQAADLKDLTEKYEVKSITGFDMFPQTNHIESVVILINR